MTMLESMIRNRAAIKPSKRTARQLITLKSRNSYIRCLKYLKANGIKPFKAVPRCLLVGFHFQSGASLSAISKHPEVKKVEKDFKIKIHAAASPKRRKTVKRSQPLLKLETAPSDITWNIDRVQAPVLWPLTKGGNVKVAVIDTGIANHPDLRIAGGINTINGGSYADDNGHGTHVAGIIAGNSGPGKLSGTAPNVELYAVKALDANGDGYVSDIIEGIDWCVSRKMNVINMSFGLIGSGSSGALHDAVRRAVNQGIVIVASAGNSGKSGHGIDEPAAFEESIAVAASTKSNHIAKFSSRGKGITITAPGQNILSTWLSNAYTKLSGTSMASPHVAGGAALLLSRRPGLSPASVTSQLRNKALKLYNYSVLAQGAGLLRLARIFKPGSTSSRKGSVKKALKSKPLLKA